jgi:choline monooxygenase
MERMTFYFVGDEAMGPENEALRHLPIDLWKDTNDEDIDMIERMQVGVNHPASTAAASRQSWSRTVYRFQQMVAKAVGE